MKQRVLYPDICKFIAIFLVTWSHCAQCISGELWSNFLGGRQIDIAFNMPLFMLISGWFINLDRIRSTKALEYISSKFKRLIVPSITWFLIHCILILHFPDKSIFTYFWYLNALFACMCIIFLAAKLIKNDALCCILSILLVLLMPYSDYSNINFMFPFIWAGYGLRRIIESKYATLFCTTSFLIGVILCFFWSPDYTVYLSPFSITRLTHNSLIYIYIYIYRFAAGFTLSAFIIFLTKKIPHGKLANQLARMGTYSLVLYTSSLTILGPLRKLASLFNLHNNDLFILDIISLLLCLVFVILAIKLADICKKHKYLSFLLLGE